MRRRLLLEAGRHSQVEGGAPPSGMEGVGSTELLEAGGRGQVEGRAPPSVMEGVGSTDLSGRVCTPSWGGSSGEADPQAARAFSSTSCSSPDW